MSVDVITLLIALVWVMEIAKVLVVVLGACLIVGLLREWALDRFTNRRVRRVINILRHQ